MAFGNDLRRVCLTPPGAPHSRLRCPPRHEHAVPAPAPSSSCSGLRGGSQDDPDSDDADSSDAPEEPCVVPRCLCLQLPVGGGASLLAMGAGRRQRRGGKPVESQCRGDDVTVQLRGSAAATRACCSGRCCPD